MDLAVDNLVRNPPSWIVAVVIAILTAHAIDKLVEFVARRRSHNGLVPILELFVVLVLSFLALHSYYEGMFKTEDHDLWYDRPFGLIVALVVYALGSMALYLVSRTQFQTSSPKRRGRRPKIDN